MKADKYIKLLVFILFTLSGNSLSAGATDTADDYLGDLIAETISDVVDSTVERAKGVVREKTGIDLSRHGYVKDRKHRPLPGCASDEAYHELNRLQDEYSREIRKLEEELNRKLSKAESEFEREASREDKKEKIREKRITLEQKVDDAYAKFDSKVAAQDRKFDEKRSSIINRERGSERCDKDSISNKNDNDDKGRDASDRKEHADEDNPGRGGVPEHARESQASATARDKSVAHGEADEKSWWQFWK
jgi:hypothetical protein